MTTILYHHESRQIFYDSRETDGNRITTDKIVKKIENKHGIWFCCGDSSDIDFVINDFRERQQPNAGNLNFRAFLVRDNKVFDTCINNGVYKTYLLGYSETMGSGGEYALGALEAGASAMQSMKIAAKRDIRTGGKIHKYKLD